jgi:hypothetical protein
MTKRWRSLAAPVVLILALYFYVQLFSAWGRASYIAHPRFFDSSRNRYVYSTPLALNPNSTMYIDIVGIYHDAESSSIRVIVQDNSMSSDNSTAPSRKACLRPYLIGRLSGPAIGMVSQWVYTPKSAVNTTIEGHYEVQVPGTYFLEIIVILCNTYDEEKLRQAQNVTGPGDWKEDASMQREMKHVVDHCVEHPEHHRLTAQNLSIQVTRPTVAQNPVVSRSSGSLGGYWEWNTSNNQPMEPLYTRYEELSCIGVENCQLPAASLDRFSPYRFVWTSNVNLTEHFKASESIGRARVIPRHVVDEETLRTLIRYRSQRRLNETICLIGDSHSHEMFDYLTRLMDSPVFRVWTSFANDLGENVTAESGSLSNSSFEDQVNRYLLIHGGLGPRQCTVFVVGIGGWVRALSIALEQR